MHQCDCPECRPCKGRLSISNLLKAVAILLVIVAAYSLAAGI